MRKWQHSLKFALEQTYLARTTVNGVVVEVEEDRATGKYTLKIGSSALPPFETIPEVEDFMVEHNETYVKGSRVWEDIGD